MAAGLYEMGAIAEAIALLHFGALLKLRNS